MQATGLADAAEAPAVLAGALAIVIVIIVAVAAVYFTPVAICEAIVAGEVGASMDEGAPTA
jgi:hypothetical protein